MLAFWQKDAFGAKPQSPLKLQKGILVMANLTRSVQLNFRVTQEEKERILDNMKQCRITNMNEYLRTMAIRGCIIIPDHSDIKRANYEINKIGVNINQIAKKVNETGNLYAEDLHRLQELIDNIWQLLKSTLLEEL